MHKAQISKTDIETILAYIRTREEQGVVHAALGMLTRGVGQKGTRAIENILETRLPAHVGGAFEKIISSAPYKGDYAKLKAFLAALKAAVEKMRLMTLDLAFEPSAEMIEKISTWITENVGSDIVLAFKLDRSIIGGARIMFAGKYTEKTLDKKINHMFEKEQNMVLQMLH